jgi:hypothetical protein
MEDIIRQIGNQALYAKKLQQSLRNINKRELEPIKRHNLLNDEVKNIDDSSQHLLVDASFKEKIEIIVTSIKSEIFELDKVVKADFGRKLAEKLREGSFELEGHYPNLKTFIYTLNVSLFNFFWFFSNFKKQWNFTQSLNIFPHFGKVAPLISRFCTSISYFCHNYSIATAVKLQIKTESFHLLFTYPYWNLALIKGENPFHFPVLKYRLLK